MNLGSLEVTHHGTSANRACDTEHLPVVAEFMLTNVEKTLSGILPKDRLRLDSS